MKEALYKCSLLGINLIQLMKFQNYKVILLIVSYVQVTLKSMLYATNFAVLFSFFYKNKSFSLYYEYCYYLILILLLLLPHSIDYGEPNED